jgi:hypothetical protein
MRFGRNGGLMSVEDYLSQCAAMHFHSLMPKVDKRRFGRQTGSILTKSSLYLLEFMYMHM